MGRRISEGLRDAVNRRITEGEEWRKMAIRLSNMIRDLMDAEGGEPPDPEWNPEGANVWHRAEKALESFWKLKNRA